MWTRPTGSSSESRKTGMREWPELRKLGEEIAEADVDLDRLDVGARHHDVVDAHLAQAEDVGEHRPLFRREAAGDVLGGERVGEILADRAGALQADGGAQLVDPALPARASPLAARGAWLGSGSGFARRSVVRCLLMAQASTGRHQPSA